jgi:PAS domain S-box-containing protein
MSDSSSPGAGPANVSSSDLLDVLKVLQPVVYGALGVIAFVHWRRRPGQAGGWLAASLGVLGLAVVVAQVLPESSADPVVVWGRKVVIAILVLFPYCLYRFMASFVRPARWVRVTAPLLTVAAALGAVVVPEIPARGEPRPGWFQIYLVALLIQWVFLSGLVAVRLWRAGRGQPTVARRRMQTMSLGATGLALALVVSGGDASQSPGAEVIVGLLALAAAPLMLIGFAPPFFLRLTWRREEESALKEARLSLMRATMAPEVARTLLAFARLLVGARAALLEDAEGEIVATDGLDKNNARAALRDDRTASHEGAHGSLVTVPVGDHGGLTVVAGPFTPFFGREEVASLEGLAVFADLALARNQLLESQRRLAQIVACSDDAIVSTTLDGVITSWNRGAQKLFQYTAEEVVGKPTSVLAPPELAVECAQLWAKLRRGVSIEGYETRRLIKGGRTIEVSLTLSPVRDADGNVVEASTIARDVSERNRAEREREAAREEAHAANQSKSEFLSRMSHELRTPLNAIIGFGQLLEMNGLDETQREYVDRILRGGQHLLKLINEVLDISRIESGTVSISLEPIDADAAVAEALELIGPMAAQRGLRVAAPARPPAQRYVVADQQRLKQILLNLLSNAVKYNRDGGSITVSIEERDDRLRILVTDTGSGLTAEQQDRLFVPFERLGAEAGATEGTGLGLALSKALAEVMQGDLELIASKPSAGSTFAVDLPRGQPAGAGVAGPAPAPRDLPEPAENARLEILYIEDNLSNLRLVEEILSYRPQVKLLVAMQGGLGLELAAQCVPDLVILDLHLPDIPGHEVLARLRSAPATAAIPVVVLSADATEGQIRRLLQAGAQAYLTKPLDVRRLLELVDEYVSRKLSHDERADRR